MSELEGVPAPPTRRPTVGIRGALLVRRHTRPKAGLDPRGRVRRCARRPGVQLRRALPANGDRRQAPHAASLEPGRATPGTDSHRTARARAHDGSALSSGRTRAVDHGGALAGHWTDRPAQPRVRSRGAGARGRAREAGGHRHPSCGARCVLLATDEALAERGAVRAFARAGAEDSRRRERGPHRRSHGGLAAPRGAPVCAVPRTSAEDPLARLAFPIRARLADGTSGGHAG